MNKESSYNIDILFEALKNVIANISITIYEGVRDLEQIKNYTRYYSAICLKAYCNYIKQDKKYTKKRLASNAYTRIYAQAFRAAIKDQSDLSKYFDISIYGDRTEDEKFLIFTILNLPSFFKTNNINMTKHILNTYIPKARKCLKNSDEYIKYFSSNPKNSLKVKTLLFKFLIENG